jgi:Uma2 family endonuclease
MVRPCTTSPRPKETRYSASSDPAGRRSPGPTDLSEPIPMRICEPDGKEGTVDVTQATPTTSAQLTVRSLMEDGISIVTVARLPDSHRPGLRKTPKYFKRCNHLPIGWSLLDLPETGRLLPVRSAGIATVIKHFPADHNRYEVVDGVVTIDGQEPTRRELAFLCLYTRLAAARPPRVEVLAALPDIRASFNTEPVPDVRPDIVVVASADQSTHSTPLLVVEVLSWRNNLIDLGTRMETYERLGVRSCWMVDPVEPLLVAYELDDQGKYRRTAKASGNEPFETTVPFPVRIVLTEPFGRDARQN